jgi:uncharacterized membrane protein
MIIAVIGILLLISVLMAYRSLRQMQQMETVDEAKDVLKKGKVVFQDDSSSVVSPESSS